MRLRKLFAVLCTRLCTPSCVSGLAACVVIAGACGGSAPRLSLLQVMYQVDYDDQRLRAAVGRGDLATVLEAGQKIQRSFEDPAFAQYLERPDLLAPVARFQESRQTFSAALAEVLGAAQSGDAGRTNMAYARMRMTCELCHRDFRPGI